LGDAYTASIIPAVVGGLCLVGCLVALLIFFIKRSHDTTDDWEVNYEELEVGEQLGVGGYGAVHKAMWKGTEVAVKVMLADKITRDMEKGFKDEVPPPKNHQVFPSLSHCCYDCWGQVRVMTSLRHPNVVLFMAASTKAPKMCIVMEYMALGSLFDVRACPSLASPPYHQTKQDCRFDECA
jgi:serine/threonine protein kinase